jgi:hypothetical protein
VFEKIEEALTFLESFDDSAQMFYHQWWSGHQLAIETHPAKDFSETVFHEPIRVIKTGKTTSAGFASNGLKVVKFHSGEYVDSGNGYGLIFRRKSWQTSFWKWMSTSTPVIQRPDNSILRIYIPSTGSEEHSTLYRLYEIFEDLELGATMKQRLSPGVFSDHIVIWVPEYDLHSALRGITSRELSFLKTPPPLTFDFRGLGIADHPDSGESLGMKYCDFLWGFSKGACTSNLAVAASEIGLNLDSPWILNNRKKHSDWLKALV